MDLATIIGLIGGTVAIGLGVVTSGGSIGGIIDIPSVFVTVGGSYMALFIVAPLKQALGLFKIMGRALKTHDYGEKTLIQNMVALSEKARREGILALEEGLDDLDSPFMKEGLRMVVDGTDSNVVRTIMENEMSAAEARHMSWIGVVNAWAGYGPGFGMLGTVIGLIGMLNNLEDKSSLGPNMAVALITTLYGSMLANMIFTPISNKLKAKHQDEMFCKEICVAGILAIQFGENPKNLESKLLNYLSDSERAKAAKTAE